MVNGACYTGRYGLFSNQYIIQDEKDCRVYLLIAKCISFASNLRKQCLLTIIYQVCNYQIRGIYINCIHYCINCEYLTRCTTCGHNYWGNRMIPNHISQIQWLIQYFGILCASKYFVEYKVHSFCCTVKMWI